MAKAFSVAAWNVEHFGAIDSETQKPKKPIQPIIDFIKKQKADIVAIFEVRSEHVFRPIVECMPGYQFYMTEGPQMQETLIGVRSKLNAFVTQKIEFRSGQTSLRPGVLVTPIVDGEYYPLLFLHLKSMTDPKGFGLRHDMLQRAMKFRRVLDSVRRKKNSANFIFLGDLNTMGLDLAYTKHDISGADEIAEMERAASYKNMRRLKKSHEISWWNGSETFKPGSSLDHVMAADHMKFKKFRGGAEVSVRGWTGEKTEVKQKKWIDSFSDHALLYFEVQKVEKV